VVAMLSLNVGGIYDSLIFETGIYGSFTHINMEHLQDLTEILAHETRAPISTDALYKIANTAESTVDQMIEP
jgi:hypothetical protein